MFSFFKQKPKNTFAEILKVDMHSHLIPAIDDGSQNVESSLLMLRKLSELGYKKVITTPHIMKDFYPNSMENIRNGLIELNSELKKNNVDILVEVAAEYYIDKHFEDLLESDEILCFGSKRYVLIELSFVSPAPNFESIVFTMLTKGYTPILAHPERYNYWADNKNLYSHLKDIGCNLQVNIPSLLGYYGKNIKNTAYGIIKNEFCDFLGTDLHNLKHLSVLEEGSFDNQMNTILNKYEFKNSILL